MNHLTALQRTDGRWDYTRNRRPVGYCQSYHPLDESGIISPEMAKSENERMKPFEGKFHDTGHATKEEACDCYKEFLLDTHAYFPAKEPESASQQFKCQICGAWTACMAQVGPYRIFQVCPAHCTREHVATLLTVGESWES